MLHMGPFTCKLEFLRVHYQPWERVREIALRGGLGGSPRALSLCLPAMEGQPRLTLQIRRPGGGGDLES